MSLVVDLVSRVRGGSWQILRRPCRLVMEGEFAGWLA
jgi:hypothetical protein